MPRFRIAYVSVFVFVLICSSILPVSAADREFRVSSYIPDKFQDFQWLVSGGTSLRGACDTRAKYPTDPDRTWVVDGRTESNNYGLSLSSTVNYRYETIPRNFEFHAWLSGKAEDRGSEKTDNGRELPYNDSRRLDESDVTSYDLTLIVAPEFDQYLTSNLFWQVSGYARFNFRERDWGSATVSSAFYTDTVAGQIVERLDKEEHRGRSTSKNHSLEGRLLLGWGRLHEGRHGATALFMVEDLRREGLLIDSPTTDQMQHLARLLHTRREGSSSDERLHRISSLDSIITYLTTIGAIEDPAQYGHLLIQDVWDYYPAYSRSFGWRLRGGIVGEQDRSIHDEWSSDSTSYVTVREYTDSVGLVDTLQLTPTKRENSWNNRNVTHTDYFTGIVEYHLPAGLHWQLSWQWYVRAYLDRRQSERKQSNFHSYHDLENRYELAASTEARYIFDARTDFLAALSGAHYHQKDIRSTTYNLGQPTEFQRYDAIERRRWIADLDCGLTYRVSLPTMLQVNLNVNWTNDCATGYDNRSKEVKFSYSLNTAVQHYLF